MSRDELIGEFICPETGNKFNVIRRVEQVAYRGLINSRTLDGSKSYITECGEKLNCLSKNGSEDKFKVFRTDEVIVPIE